MTQDVGTLVAAARIASRWGALSEADKRSSLDLTRSETAADAPDGDPEVTYVEDIAEPTYSLVWWCEIERRPSHLFGDPPSAWDAVAVEAAARDHSNPSSHYDRDPLAEPWWRDQFGQQHDCPHCTDPSAPTTPCDQAYVREVFKVRMLKPAEKMFLLGGSPLGTPTLGIGGEEVFEPHRHAEHTSVLPPGWLFWEGPGQSRVFGPKRHEPRYRHRPVFEAVETASDVDTAWSAARVDRQIERATSSSASPVSP